MSESHDADLPLDVEAVVDGSYDLPTLFLGVGPFGRYAQEGEPDDHLPATPAEAELKRRKAAGRIKLGSPEFNFVNPDYL